MRRMVPPCELDETREAYIRPGCRVWIDVVRSVQRGSCDIARAVSCVARSYARAAQATAFTAAKQLARRSGVRPWSPSGAYHPVVEHRSDRHRRTGATAVAEHEAQLAAALG